MPERARFLYQSVALALRGRLSDGTYHPGERIPGVEELAQEFGVSTITVRRAVRDLSLEGLLVGRQGLGLFVAKERRIHRFLTPNRIDPIEQDIRRAGLEPGIQELDLTLVPPGDDASIRVLARSSHSLYRLERVLLAEREPVGLDTVWLPRRLGDLLKPELHGHFVIPLLKTHDISIDHIDYKFGAATATESQAIRLNVTNGFPLLVITFTLIGTKGTPIVVGRTTTRADRFTYEFCQRPEAHRGRKR